MVSSKSCVYVVFRRARNAKTGWCYGCDHCNRDKHGCDIFVYASSVLWVLSWASGSSLLSSCRSVGLLGVLVQVVRGHHYRKFLHSPDCHMVQSPLAILFRGPGCATFLAFTRHVRRRPSGACVWAKFSLSSLQTSGLGCLATWSSPSLSCTSGDIMCSQVVGDACARATKCLFISAR